MMTTRKKRTLPVEPPNGKLTVTFWCLIAVFLLLVTVQESSANGRFPATKSVRFQPGDSQRILLSSTFGLLLSEDDGSNFKWICEDAIGYGGTYDPDYAITSDGAIYATTFEGLRVSRDGACTFEATEFYGDLSGGSNPVLLSDYWVGEVEIASNGKIWAATANGGKSNDVYVSVDGSRFDSANNWHDTAWWKTLRVSKSNPDVVYVTGYLIAIDPAPAQALLLKTIDGGANWIDLGTADFTFGSQPNLFLEGISSTDPNIVYARISNVRVPQSDDLYRSADGGITWTKVLEMAGTISAFVLREDGSVLAGTATPCLGDMPDLDAGLSDKGCLRVSPSGLAGTWTTPATEPKLECLGERRADNTLFGCGHNWVPDNFALGISPDSGDSWNKIVRFSEISGPLECPVGTIQETCEQLNWPSVCLVYGICDPPDAGLVDGGTSIGPDSGTDSKNDDSGCGCQTSPKAGSTFLLMFLALGLIARSKRRSKKR